MSKRSIASKVAEAAVMTVAAPVVVAVDMVTGNEIDEKAGDALIKSWALDSVSDVVTSDD